MTTHLRVDIRAATPPDAEAVAGLLAEAFLHGDLAGWLIPDLDTRARIYPPYFRLLTQHALTHGHIDLTDDGAAVAVWYRIARSPVPGLPHYDRRLADITGDAYSRFASLDRAMHQHHPYLQPHHYLALLAVHPDRQNQGLGNALLAHHHTRLDAPGIPAYLEATGERNRRLYLRHGYHPRPAYPITPDGPHLIPMWRPPAATTIPE